MQIITSKSDPNDPRTWLRAHRNSKGRLTWSYPPPDDPPQAGEVAISFGRYRHWTLRQVVREHGSQYVRWLIAQPRMRETRVDLYREARRIVLEELRRETEAEALQ